MTRKASRALKAALAIGAVAVLSLSLVAMSACSTNAPAGHATKNVIEEPASSVSPTDCDGTLDAVAYMNYTLAQQNSWHSEKETKSESVLSLGILGSMTVDTTTTKTQKDYKDGVLIAEESVYSSTYKGSSHQFMFDTDEDNRVAYVRTGEGPTTDDDGNIVWDVTWDDETTPECWSEAYYNTQYGLFMDEISLYVLNYETLLDAKVDEKPDETEVTSYEIQLLDEEGDGSDGDDVNDEQGGDGDDETGETGNGEGEVGQSITSDACGDVIDNGDGTYSQTIQLDTENSIYYYQYSMMTHGGLSSAPEFSSVEVTFTFDSDWKVREIEETDVATVTAGAVNTSVTTTTFEYGEDAVDTETFEAGYAFFEPFVGTLEIVDIASDVEDENDNLASQDVEYTQYEKNLTLTVTMAVIVGIVIVLGIILTGVGCSTGGKKKNEQQGEDEEKKN